MNTVKISGQTFRFWQENERDTNITHATVKFSDRHETYYTAHTVETLVDFENVCRAYIRGDGPGGGAVTVEILSSRSRRYPAGSIWRLVWEEDEPGYFLARERGI